MDSAHKKEWLKILREAKTGQNLYLEDISKMPDLDQKIAEFKGGLSELEARGYPALRQDQKFERSEQSQEYRSLYNFLCCDTHNNLRSLFARHAQISDDKSDFVVQFLSPIDPSSDLQYIDSTLGILLGSAQIIHRALSSKNTGKLEALDTDLAALRADWLA